MALLPGSPWRAVITTAAVDRSSRKAIVATGVLAVLCACGSSKKEFFSVGTLPPAAEDAVFGLSWQHSESDLLAAGVIAGRPEPFRGGLGRMYSTVRLPRRFADAGYSALFFNQAGQLVRIACVGKTFLDDPEGVAARKRYEELKAIVSRKIPIVGTYERREEPWAAPSGWWLSLQQGKVHWATGFRGEVMEAVLEIRAESSTSGSYSLIVDHLPRMQALDQAAEQEEKSAF